MAATISSIPEANTAYAQMDALNQAVAALNTGSTVINLTVSAPPAPADDPTKFTLPIAVVLNPPISDTATIAALVTALNTQAQAICDQLVAAGYIDDLDEMKLKNPAPPPAPWVPPAGLPPSMPMPPYAPPQVTPFVHVEHAEMGDPEAADANAA